MPYMIVPEGDQFCVYTQGSDKKPVGKPHGKFATRKQAVEQMRALYANMPDSEKALPNSVGNILQANIHDAFTSVSDMLAKMGYVNIDQRIRMSAMIGNMLEGVPKALGDINDIQVQADDVGVLATSPPMEENMFDAEGWDDDAYYAQEEEDSLLLPQFKTRMQNLGGKRVDRDKLPASRFVFPDERKFPIVTAASVMAAVHRWGTYKGKHSFEDFKRKLTSLAKRLGFGSHLPESWGKAQAKAMAEAILYSAAKSLYDSGSDYVWTGVSHNAWQDDIQDIIPLDLILDDIEWQKSKIAKGEWNQFGEGLWIDHDPSKVIGDCLVREVLEGGRSCIEGGQLKSGNEKLNGVQMSIGYKALTIGGNYLLVYVRERSALEKTHRVNGRTFFSVKRGRLLEDAAVKSIADDISAYVLGG